ncbi:NACHT domain-containing protein [Nonomuraea lactucae]|uniref:NACHT domain-containing protein n=1 Tax=Nonomuraea lactucae TaxID=2249762 RepID=UPI0013B409D7|nr:NACHT domain-containing protein [Nonomuraea lactucae]
MRGRRGALLGVATALLTIPIGVAVNQVLNEGTWSLPWIGVALLSVIVASVADRRWIADARREDGPAAPARRWPRPDFGRQYAQYVLSSLRFIDQKGLPTVGFHTPELDEVFVEVHLARRAPHDVSSDPLADLPGDVTERLSLGDFLDRPEPAILAVTGAAGSGKTTLLRRTARDISSSPKGRRRRVAVLLNLREHVDAVVRDPRVPLPEVARATLGRLGATEPPTWLERQFTEGACVVLLDGLDEIARDEDRRKISGWVEDQIAHHPGNDYVITSRPYGYRTAPVQGALVLQVRRLTDEQVERFVRSWYLAVERRSTGERDDDVRSRAAAESADLLSRLRANPGLYDLTANPLLLTMIANVHRFRGALPGSRTDLYRDICEVMLWRRHEAKDLAHELKGEDKETVVRVLAYAMMERQVRDLPRGEIVPLVAPVLERLATPVPPDRFLDDVGASGLLIEKEPGLHSFVHHTFQEYLAAEHIHDHRLVGVLADAVDDVWWRDTTLLYSSRADADAVIAAALESGTVSALTLALDCVEQRADVAPELRRRLTDVLTGGPRDDIDPERRRLHTRVVLTRHLHRLAPVAGDGLLCVQPISALIYRLFQRDVADSGVDRTPGTPLPADPDAPVAGIRAEDAAALVRWVNDLLGEDLYRLPTQEEMRDAAARKLIAADVRSVWTHSDLGPRRRWTLTETGETGATPFSERIVIARV